MNLSRRSLLVTAPAVILTPHLLMPVKPWGPVFSTGLWKYAYSEGKIYEYVGQWREGGNARWWREL